jgi:hypothetical protein
MKPFKLRVDWTVHDAYPGDPVEVILDIMDSEPRVIHRCDTPDEGAGWASKWFRDRGITFWCDIDRHQRVNDKYIVLHAVGRKQGISEKS